MNTQEPPKRRYRNPTLWGVGTERPRARLLVGGRAIAGDGLLWLWYGGLLDVVGRLEWLG